MSILVSKSCFDQRKQ